MTAHSPTPWFNEYRAAADRAVRAENRVAELEARVAQLQWQLDQALVTITNLETIRKEKEQWQDHQRQLRDSREAPLHQQLDPVRTADSTTTLSGVSISR